MDLVTVTSYRVARDRADLVLAPGEAYLAGGTWLMSEPQPAVTGLVDLGGLDWPPVERLADGSIRIAATCTVEQLLAYPWPASLAGLVRDCADALLMSFKVQHAATVGGNLCLALPAGAMTSLLAALGAQVEVWAGPAERHQPVTDFVVGASATTLAPGEVLRAATVPPDAAADTWAMRRIALTAYGRSAALVVGRRSHATGGLRLTVTASTPRPFVVDLPADATPSEARGALARVPAWYDDPHGAPDWRAAVTAELAADVLEELTR